MAGKLMRVQPDGTFRNERAPNDVMAARALTRRLAVGDRWEQIDPATGNKRLLEVVAVTTADTGAVFVRSKGV